MRELGWTEGTNIEYRFHASGGRDEAFVGIAEEVVRANVDLIVTVNSGSTRAAMRATDRIPIVFGSAANPVEQKFVASLALPGGNVTGLALLAGARAEETAAPQGVAAARDPFRAPLSGREHLGTSTRAH